VAKKFPIGLLTALIVISLTFGYVNTTGVAPFIPSIINHYGLDPIQDQALINMLVSIVFPLFIVFAFVGTFVGKKFGLRTLFSLILLLTGAGTCLTLLCDKSFALLFVTRIIFGIGMGMNIPFAGMRVLAWYREKNREKMNALDALQALFGGLISYLFIPGIALVIGQGDMDKGFLFAIASPGFVVLVCWLILLLRTDKSIDSVDRQKEEDPNYVEPAAEKNMFGKLIKRKDVVLLMIAAVCDLGVLVTFYSVLPRWMMIGSGWSEYTASIWTGLALPLFCCLGVLIGTSIAIRSGKRKPIIVACQFLKCAAIFTACFGAEHSVVFLIIGAAMYGLGNAAWMMPLAQLIMELPDMNPVRFGGSLTLVQAASGAAALVVPIVQGVLSTYLIMNSGLIGEDIQLAYGFKWSVFILGMMSIISIIATLFLRETGKGRSVKDMPVNEVVNRVPS